jgi:hypothetical protein
MICREKRQLKGGPVSIQEPAFFVCATRPRLHVPCIALLIPWQRGNCFALVLPAWPSAKLLRLAFKPCDGASAEPAFDLLDRADDQLIARLGLRRIDRMSRQLKHTCRLNPQRRNPESGEMLDNMDDPMILIQVDQIKGKEDSQCMNSLRRYDPQSFVEFELQSPD